MVYAIVPNSRAVGGVLRLAEVRPLYLLGSAAGICALAVRGRQRQWSRWQEEQLIVSRQL